MNIRCTWQIISDNSDALIASFPVLFLFAEFKGTINWNVNAINAMLFLRFVNEWIDLYLTASYSYS